MRVGTTNIKSFRSSPYRVDPSYHLSEGVKVRKQLSLCPYGLSTLKDGCERIFLGNIFSRVFVRDSMHGIPYLSASDTVLSDLETGRFLSKNQAADLAYLILDRDWILVTCSGTLGNVSYTNDVFKGRIATHDLIRIVPNNQTFLKGYLYAFLSGRYGYYQLTQSQFGGVVKHINADQAGAIVVPCLPDSFQKEVDALVLDSASLRDAADKMLKEAVSILQENIKIGVSGIKKKIAYSNNKEIVASLQHRLDPPALINDGVNAMKYVRNNLNYKVMRDIRLRVYRPGIFKRSYVSDGYPYIKGSEIFERNPFLRCVYVSRTKTPFVDEMLLREGQILVTCAGSVGSIKLITKEYENKGAIGSQDIIRIESGDDLFTKEYLFAYLKLPFVQDYIQSMKYGAVIERIEPFHVESIPVVTPTKEISTLITAKIKGYMQYSYEAFIKEEKAQMLVEAEIEKWK